jgi:presenilin-like A22 family membrane protease
MEKKTILLLLLIYVQVLCSDVLSHVSAIALASMIFAEPFWNVINSDEH